MLESEENYSFDDDFDNNRKMYKLFKEKFALSAIRSDERDIKTIEFVSKKK